MVRITMVELHHPPPRHKTVACRHLRWEEQAEPLAPRALAGRAAFCVAVTCFALFELWATVAIFHRLLSTM